MKNDIRKRFLRLFLILFGITILSFSLLAFSPGDPALKKLTSQGIGVTNEVLKETRVEMGLDKPVAVQYGRWLINLLKGDLGTSYRDGAPVVRKLKQAFLNTVILSFSSLLLALVLSLPLGVLAAARRNQAADQLIRLFCFTGNALPSFLLAVLFIYFFCIQHKVFPVIANNSFKGLILPVMTLAVPLSGRLIRQVRAAVLRELELDYVKGIRQRGVLEGYVLFFNVLHNAMISIITAVGLSVGTLMGGSVVVESIFLWPGMGKLIMDSISARDYPVIQGAVIVMSVLYVMLNFITDLMYHLLDPRLKEL